MTSPLTYQPATRSALFVAVERTDELGEAFAEWALMKMFATAVEIAIEALLQLTL